MSKREYFKITPCCDKVTTKDFCPECKISLKDYSADKKDAYSSTKIEFFGKKTTLKKGHNTFKFKCLMCGDCCRNSRLSLSPYDSMILAKRLGLSLKEFREKYTVSVIDKCDDYLPSVLLKTKGGCVFLKDDKCSVYEDRPFLCRMYPLGYHLIKNKSYFLYRPKCDGFKVNKRITINQHIESNFTEEDLEVYRLWLKFRTIMKSFFPRNNERITAVYLKILYCFDDPIILKKIESTVGNLSRNPAEAIYQVVEFAERWLLKTYVKTVEQIIEEKKKPKTSISYSFNVEQK